MRRILLLFAVCSSWPASASADSAKDLMEMSGVKGGLVVHVGCGEGNLTAALRVNDRYLVHGLDVDAAKVAAAREAIQARGIYGPVSVSRFDGTHLPYAENLVNLLIADGDCEVPQTEVMRVLAPGGVAIVNGNRTVKPVPDSIGEWTHWLHGPDGNAVARDRVVGPPRRLQWMARPYWARLHDAPSSTSAMVSSHGRVFYISDEGPVGTYAGLEDKWSLVARDAYNGTLLWKRAMPLWGWKQWTANWHARNNQPFQLPKRLVSVGDRVYVTLGYNEPVSVLDAATGEVVKILEETQRTDEILYHEGLLILSVNKTDHAPMRNEHQPLKKKIAVLQADTGKTLWQTGNYTGLSAKTDSIGPNGRLEVAVGDGQVHFSDHDSIVTLDLQTGQEVWRTPRQFGPKLNANFSTRMYELSVLVYSDGVVLFAQPEGTISFHSVPGTLYAYDAADGQLLWKHPYGGWVHNTQPNVFVIDGTVWIHEHLEGAVALGGKRMVLPSGVQDELEYAALGLDLRSGEEKARLSTKAIFNVGHHHRCYRNKATERFLLTSRRGVEFIDTQSGENDINHWTRGDCQLGIMPCNGLLYTTPHPCSCYIETKLNGYFALAPASGNSRPDDPSPSFVKGPAFGAVAGSGRPHADDWWTFRGNPKRSGAVRRAADESIPVAERDRSFGGHLASKWKTQLGGESGPLTIAAGKVFAPVIDQHRIVALDADSGAIVWDFTAGGRVDTPPTIYKGLALFGSADGWAYCLRASDGQLVWKRRIAPRERLVGALGQLESAWPVHGSILIHDDVAYLAAGRSSFLDGGIHFCAVEPQTGDVVERRTEYTPDPQTDKMEAVSAYAHTMPGMLADILVSDGSAIWMRNNLIFDDTPSRRGPICATGGFRDDSWFNRTTWKVGPVDHAQLLVFDDSTAYGIEAYASTSRAKAFAAGDDGYRLFARSLKVPGASKSKTDQEQAARRGAKHRTADSWSVRIPVRGTAMALANNTLFVAGAPDVVDPRDPLASFEGRKGGVLWAISATDGRKLSEMPFDALPVWDAMAAAHGKLFLATRDGSVRCFGTR